MHLLTWHHSAWHTAPNSPTIRHHTPRTHTGPHATCAGLRVWACVRVRAYDSTLLLPAGQLSLLRERGSLLRAPCMWCTTHACVGAHGRKPACGRVGGKATPHRCSEGRPRACWERGGSARVRVACVLWGGAAGHKGLATVGAAACTQLRALCGGSGGSSLLGVLREGGWGRCARARARDGCCPRATAAAARGLLRSDILLLLLLQRCRARGRARGWLLRLQLGTRTLHACVRCCAGRHAIPTAMTRSRCGSRTAAHSSSSVR